MEYIQRNLAKKLTRLFKHYPAVALIGARQVGKTTLLKNVMKDIADYVVFDPVIDVENARQDPELFLDNHSIPIILDEIQYAPEVVPVIKRRIDKNRKPGQYLLTGSQQWGVLKSMAESLAGRVAIIELDGFDFREAADIPINQTWIERYLTNTNDFFNLNEDQVIHPKYKLTEQIFRGWFPEALSIPLDILNNFSNSYLRTYIERDVRLVGDISDYQLFGRFFKLVGALSAQEINFSQIGRDIGITPQTSKKWMDILKSTFQWVEVPAFSSNTIKRISGKPKGYLTDSGLMCYSLAVSTPHALTSHPLWGNIFESMAVRDILKQINVSELNPNIFHWKTHAGAEVDLLLELDGKYFPIEIKATTRPTKKATQGISALRKTYPNLTIEKGIVLCPCETIFPLSQNDYAVPILHQ
jgi:predicted AAA+ superfamily ATPase